MNALAQFEGQILLFIQNNLRSDALDGVMRGLSFLGDKGLFWIVVTFLLLAFKRTRKLGATCALSIVLTFILVNLLIKPLVARVRPYEVIEGLKLLMPPEKDFSFPSGHASNAFACAWVLFRDGAKPVGWTALILAILVSLSRLYVGVHYPSDVLIGILLGVLMAECARRLTPRIAARLPRKQ